MGKDEDIFILSVAIITVKGNNVWNIKITRSHRVTFSLLIAMVLPHLLPVHRRVLFPKPFPVVEQSAFFVKDPQVVDGHRGRES